MMPKRKPRFGRDVRLSKPHRYKSATTAETVELRGARSAWLWSIALNVLGILAGGALLFLGMPTFGSHLPLPPLLLGVTVFAASLILLCALNLWEALRRHNEFRGPREGVDFGDQVVTLDRDGVRVEMASAQRRYSWALFKEMSEDDRSFALIPKVGPAVIIPKAARQSDEIRLRLLRGLTR